MANKIDSIKPIAIKYFNLNEFIEKRDDVLILRNHGGLGDIFMHRMMFADFKRLAPEAKITFALPKQYHDAVSDHPFIDHIVDCNKVDRSQFPISYNTSKACIRYELKIAPLSDKHRSDIWADQCGITLQDHRMHIILTEEEKQKGRDLIEKHRTNSGPVVILVPISAMKAKNLSESQQKTIINNSKARGCCVIGLHNKPIPTLPTISNVSIREWMAVLYAADYVVSVDTAAFHFAGGVGKPLMGIFTFADGKVYGKYFDFVLVQKHRDDGFACGPCYAWARCPYPGSVKPCLAQIDDKMLNEGLEKLFTQKPVTTLMCR
jgi:ADP-heptose:LPS heptosyltransferase